MSRKGLGYPIGRISQTCSSQHSPAKMVYTKSLAINRFLGTTSNKLPESYGPFTVGRLNGLMDILTDTSKTLGSYMQLLVSGRPRSATDNTIGFREDDLVRDCVLAEHFQ